MSDDLNPQDDPPSGADLDELLRRLGADPAAVDAGDGRPSATERRDTAEVLDVDTPAGAAPGDVAEPGPSTLVAERVALDDAGDDGVDRDRDADDDLDDDDDDLDDDDDDDDDEDEEEEDERRSAKKALLDWLVVIVISVVVAVGVRTFVLAHFVVDGTSMVPTLHNHDRVFVNKLSYRLHDPNRGDVVVLHERGQSSPEDLIKRVIGLPGEQVSMRNCTVYIDDVPLIEPYLDPAMVTAGTCGAEFGPELVEPDKVFVMGDNRGVSSDSRALGQIDDDDLVGRAFVVFWPLGNIRWL